MSNPEEQDRDPSSVGWVPSPEQPTPPTTVEFDALVASGNALPDDPASEDDPVAAADDPSDASDDPASTAPAPTDDDATRVTPAVVASPADAAPAESQADEAPAASDVDGSPSEPVAAEDVVADDTVRITPSAAGLSADGEESVAGSEPQAPAPGVASDAAPGGADAVAGPPAPDPEPAPEPAPASGAEPHAYAPPTSFGDVPPTQTGALGGLIPEDRPEMLVAAAFAGGALVAILLRTLVRR
ncbi:MAG: hypothetical protein M0P31_11870 [Solirubrobacteraceae bacterium]|nr:hypothetical protein [Solirubrobacteraceae bacterium]